MYIFSLSHGDHHVHSTKPVSSGKVADAVIDVFLLVFACAARKSLPTVVLCMLGGGAFSELFPGGPDRYVAQYFMPALKAALEQLPAATRPARLGMMGRPDEGVMAALREASGGIPCEAYGFVPSICDGPGAELSLQVYICNLAL